jgi:putative cardiolipin synthase
MYKILIFIFSLTLFVACSSKDESHQDSMMKTTDFCTSIHRDSSVSLSQKLNPLADSMTHKTGVYVLEDGDGSMVARAWLSEYAEHSIDIQYFIFTADNVGLIAADYLVRAADRGVKVRILVDDIMVEADEQKLLILDSHENISIKIYNPGTNVGKTIGDKLGNFATNFRGANQRMHNKTYTVDGKVVITGGRNIADEYFDYDHEYNFRDRDVLLIGGVTKQIQESFELFWNSSYVVNVKSLIDTTQYNYTETNRFDNLHQYACDSNNFWPQVREKIKHIPETFDMIQSTGKLQWVDNVEFISDLPGKNDGSKGLGGGGISTFQLIKLVSQAKDSIIIQSPYLITTEVGKQLFKEAVKRGVKIKILTNSLASTDNLQAFSGYQRDREALLRTGVRIFEFKPDAAIRFEIMTGALQKKMNHTPIFGLHAKSMVIDGKITVIGTFNLDPRSANLNTECFTVIHSEKISSEVQQEMLIEIKPENAWETTLTFNPDSKSTLKKNIKAKVMKVVPKGIL